MQKKDNSVLVLAVVLIAAGILWLLRQLGNFSPFAGLHFHHLFSPFRHMFSGIGNILFSWQMVLIVTGLILIAGRRSAGVILVTLGGLLLLIKLIPFPAFSSSFFIPVLFIGVGIAFIIKTSLKSN